MFTTICVNDIAGAPDKIVPPWMIPNTPSKGFRKVPGAAQVVTGAFSIPSRKAKQSSAHAGPSIHRSGRQDTFFYTVRQRSFSSIEKMAHSSWRRERQRLSHLMIGRLKEDDPRLLGLTVTHATACDTTQVDPQRIDLTAVAQDPGLMVMEQPAVVIIHVKPRRQRQLPHIGKTGGLFAFLFGAGQRWKKQGRKNCDDGNDNQQLDERKRGRTNAEGLSELKAASRATNTLVAFVHINSGQVLFRTADVCYYEPGYQMDASENNGLMPAIAEQLVP